MNRTFETKSVGVAVGIVGARGYSGQELCRILAQHPKAELAACFGSELTTVDLVAKASAFDVVFLATPVEVSMELAPHLLKSGVKVIDLSGAFRLSQEEFEAAYGMKHQAPELLSGASYGLVPWANTQNALISNPGCFATSVLMAVLPLIKNELIRPETLVIDAKSGTTGAGKKPTENLLFSEVDGNCTPYKVGKHQHLPEIITYVKKFAGVEIDPIFTTHLLPIRRGILSSIYARLAQGVTAADISQAYASCYGSYPLFQLDESMKISNVAGSGRTHFSFTIEGDKLFAFSLIDNLLKGAASQAVENFNRLNGDSPELGISADSALLSWPDLKEGGVS